jgi:hypothetical protein
MGSEVFASPFTVLVALAVVLASSAAYYSDRKAPIVPKRRLATAYGSVLLMSAVLSAISAYVSPEEASSKWQVQPDHYWPVLLNTFLTTLVLTGCSALVGVALVGFPILVVLAKFQQATAPNLLLASILVSAILALLLSSMGSTPFRHLAITFTYVSGTHLLLALSFCLGAGLPWRHTPRANEA